jgi:DNA-binding winged helix-turn-helix (wHTH) protein
MNIQTVALNLRNTIAGKEKYLSEVYEQRKVSNGDDIVSFVTAQMLEFNIDELRRILQDVEQCEPSLPGEGYNYEKWDGDE